MGAVIVRDHTSYKVIRDSYEEKIPKGIRECTTKYVDGSIYEGWMKNGLRHGQGRLMRSDGSYFAGNWENNQRHGYGYIKNVNGITITGYWIHDIKIID
jgi:hypothetical protein